MYSQDSAPFYDFKGNIISSKETSSCTSKGGKFCSYTEKCSKAANDSCCFGSCVLLSGTEFNIKRFGNKSKEELATLSELSDFYKTNKPNKSMNQEFEVITLKEEDLSPSIAKDVKKYDQQELIDKFKKKASGFNLIYFILALLVILLIVFIAVYFAKKHANAVIQTSAHEIQTSAIQKSVPPHTPSLSEIIIYLVSKRYNYQQIRQILLQKGYNPTNIDTEIKKNYELLKSKEQTQKNN